MPKAISWDLESTWFFLELLSKGFSYSHGTIPPTSLYVYIVGKLNDKYGASPHNVESLRSKFQRTKLDYKIYAGVSTNTGLGWDEKTQIANCPKHVAIEYAKVIFTKWPCTFCYFVILFDFLYISDCGLIFIILSYFRRTWEQRR